jgi:DNA repair exonuclease SbcCD nuclease subunit
MKIAVITDTHGGVRGDNAVFLDHQERFYNEVFFPTLAERGITTVFHLGDTFDRRKYINFLTLFRMRKMYLDPMREAGIQCHTIIGNHDATYKNTNLVNSPDLLLGEYKNMTIHQDGPVELTFGKTTVILSPWITKDNYDKTMTAFKKTKATVLMGHFEIQGFEMQKGSICTHGMDRADFKNFEGVYSGHFHHPSTIGNITYLGAPYEMDWSDYGGVRGFHIFDTDTREMELVQNPLRLFHKLTYDDSDITAEEIAELDLSMLKNTFVKIIVATRNNPFLFDMFANRVADAGVADLKVVEDVMSLESIGETELVDEAKDTREILHHYADTIDTKIEKPRIKQVLDDLYSEAISL